MLPGEQRVDLAVADVQAGICVRVGGDRPGCGDGTRQHLVEATEGVEQLADGVVVVDSGRFDTTGGGVEQHVRCQGHDERTCRLTGLQVIGGGTRMRWTKGGRTRGHGAFRPTADACDSGAHHHDYQPLGAQPKTPTARTR